MSKMRTKTWLWIGCFILLYGCEKNDPPRTSGEVTITTERFLEGSTYTINGFSFEQGKVINYNPETSKKMPDLVVLAAGTLEEIEAILDMPGNVQVKPLMALAGEYEDWTIAEGFFNNYKQISDSLVYTNWINPASINQIWVIKTLEGKYGIIVLKKIEKFFIQTTRYAEVTFKWKFQPDGTKIFD